MLLTIWCDESDSKGRHYSNFYGGVLVEQQYLEEVQQRLLEAKAGLNFNGEVKWQKVTAAYKEKYKALMDIFFELVRDGKVKVRIMFRKNTYVPLSLNPEHVNKGFFLLYYQFVKFAFGLSSCEMGPHNLRFFFDKLPDNREKCEEFKSHISRLANQPSFRAAGIRIDPSHIAEADSHEHPILQCCDIVLGSINFRLNDKHLEKPEGSRTRGKRTVAKHELYKHINGLIRGIHPGFNIGVSTGRFTDADVWEHPYRHWLFIPKNHQLLPGKKKQSPTPST